MSQKTITVFGSAQPHPDTDAYDRARRLGRSLARAGFAVINGGYSGTMQAVSQGAVEAGGTAVGITCAIFDQQRSLGNRYLARAVHTPDLLARLRQLTERADGYVVLPGGVGTLLELFLVWNLRAIGITAKPCILVGPHWRRTLQGLREHTAIEESHIRLLDLVEAPEDAVELLKARLASMT